MPPGRTRHFRNFLFVSIGVIDSASFVNVGAVEFPECLFFAGKLIFQRERWYQRLLHNETAYQLQRRVQFGGLNAMVLAVRVTEAA